MELGGAVDLQHPVSLSYIEKEQLRLAHDESMKLGERVEHCFLFVRQHQVHIALALEDEVSEGQALAGEVVLIPPHCACTIQNRTVKPAEILLVRFACQRDSRQDAVAGEGKHHGQRYFDRTGFHAIRIPHGRRWMQDFLNAADEREAPEVYYRLQAHLYAVAAWYIESVHRPDAAERDLISHVAQTKRYMEEHFDRSMDIEELARTSGFSPTRFYQAFRLYTGLSPRKFMTKTRLEASLRLLAGANASIVEIAHAVGYQDEYYFSRVFKKQTGLAPTEYATSAKRRVACLRQVFRGDLAVLGITPYVSFPRGWEDDKLHVLQQLAASEPDIILTGPTDDALYRELEAIAPVVSLPWKQMPWSDRLLRIGEALGLSIVAEHWLSYYEQKASNARIHIRTHLGNEPTLLVHVLEQGYYVYGLLRKKMKDLFYDDLQIEPPAAIENIFGIHAQSLQEVVELGCRKAIFLVPQSFAKADCCEIENRWSLATGSGDSEGCLFVRNETLHYNPHVYENLIDQLVQLLIVRES